MLYRETIAVCSEIHTEDKYTVGTTWNLFNVKAGGTWSNHQAWRGEMLVSSN
jgi:hypothetical protein